MCLSDEECVGQADPLDSAVIAVVGSTCGFAVKWEEEFPGSLWVCLEHRIVVAFAMTFPLVVLYVFGEPHVVTGWLDTLVVSSAHVRYPPVVESRYRCSHLSMAGCEDDSFPLRW